MGRIRKRGGGGRGDARAGPDWVGFCSGMRQAAGVNPAGGLGLSSPAAGCSGCCGIVENILGLLEAC